MNFYSEEQLEELADSINNEHCPERMNAVLPLDPYNLLEKLGLEVEWKFISPSKDVLGMVFFEDAMFPIWEKGSYKKGDKPHFELFKKGTIVINSVLTENKRERKKEMFVCTHEITHWIKDQDFFKNHPNELFQICNKDSFGDTRWSYKKTELERVEKQNNFLCAALIMPRRLIKTAFFKAMRYKNIPNEPIEYRPFMKKHIAKLAEGFGVNYNPVLYRLFDLRILERPDKKEVL